MRGLLILLLLLLGSFLVSAESSTESSAESSATSETNSKTESNSQSSSESSSESSNESSRKGGGEKGGRWCFVKLAGKSVKSGEIFRHPMNKCIICKCCTNGRYTCWRRICSTPQCGTSKQTAFSRDGCCKKCCEECKTANCPTLTCPTQAYKHNSCCKSCGCVYNGVAVPEGPFGHVCENCSCQANGATTCNRPACPSQKLECINPTFDDPEKCNYVCPDGEHICRRGNTIIPANSFISINDKVCTCVSNNWYTRASCSAGLGVYRNWNQIREAQNYRCMVRDYPLEIKPNPLLKFQGPSIPESGESSSASSSNSNSSSSSS